MTDQKELQQLIKDIGGQMASAQKDFAESMQAVNQCIDKLPAEQKELFKSVIEKELSK